MMNVRSYCYCNFLKKANGGFSNLVDILGPKGKVFIEIKTSNSYDSVVKLEQNNKHLWYQLLPYNSQEL